MNSSDTRQPGPVVIDIENITKDYVMGEEIVRALRGVSLQIRRNERERQIDVDEHARVSRHPDIRPLRI